MRSVWPLRCAAPHSLRPGAEKKGRMEKRRTNRRRAAAAKAAATTTATAAIAEAKPADAATAGAEAPPVAGGREVLRVVELFCGLEARTKGSNPLRATAACARE